MKYEYNSLGNAFANALLAPDRTEAQHLFASALMAASAQGHVCVDLENLEPVLSTLNPDISLEKFIALFKEGAETFPKELIESSPGKKRPDQPICIDYPSIYLQKYWVYETELIEALTRLLTAKSNRVLNLAENPNLNSQQQSAVETALTHPVTLISGGPGTGKTYTAAQIVKEYLKAGGEWSSVILAAPTGKAAFQLESNIRAASASGKLCKSGTIHSLLATKEKEQTLWAELIIIDECSMIDLALFSALLQKIPQNSHLVLIGDPHQLPPVEAGTVFADLIIAAKKNPLLPVIELTECLRVERKEILSLATQMREGNAEEAMALLQEGTDVGLFDRCDLSYLWEKYQGALSSFFDHPEALCKEGDFRLLSCIRQGPLGVDAINRYFLKKDFDRRELGKWWAIPILITKNDPAQELFNGDTGILIRKVTENISLYCILSR